jgi:hypothetical protein
VSFQGCTTDTQAERGQAALPYLQLLFLESFFIVLWSLKSNLSRYLFFAGRYFLLIAFISDSSITGAGPEIPPSLRIRQKCTAIKIDATSGIPMQCQM